MPSRFQAAALAAVLHLGACTGDRPAPSRDQAGNDAGDPATDSVAETERRDGCDRTPGVVDRTICLPYRVGPLTPSTRRSDLATLFPGAILHDDSVPAGEGMMATGTVVNSGHRDELTILWTDASRNGIAALQIRGPAWRTVEGLGVGSTLTEIEAALGTVMILGFGWDYGGTIILDGTSLADRGLFLRTQPRDPSIRGSAAWRRVRGDVPFPTDDPDVQALELVVHRVDLRFP